ncbi:hypothetical protein DYBT9275_04040 [Dyadobacter sp. CECT 9275]|uniref:PorV/PorQ family protein n=1 Tax=Dyadobacter helix TaxID=2822344 RepID=A0A916JEJ1_9BACT|nr:hypothetical protein [Dyadobacter sp. CECT 9275]CAG5007415.1 hypothetical protein DYBT9275_04040 [Dyadobacter sp. CECT 9275]
MKEQSGYLTRQKNFILFFILFGTSIHFSLAEGNPFVAGARAWGIANATVARHDQFSIYGNAAGMAASGQPALFSSFDSHFGFEGLNTVAFAITSPLSSDLSGGFSVLRFGDKFYNEFAMAIGAGHRINQVSLGMKVNYLQTAVNISSLSTSHRAAVMELGGIVKVTPALSVGAHMYNLLQSSYSGDLHARVPTVLKAGFQYSSGETVTFSAEMNKHTDQPVAFRAGLEYRFLKQLYLRTGISTRPVMHYFGTGFSTLKFRIDYAVSTHPQLGWSHHFSLLYLLKSAKGQKEKHPAGL